MSASALARRPTDPREDRRTIFAVAIWSALSLVAAVVLGRRVSGAFRVELDKLAPCLAGTVAVLLSLAANALWSAANPQATPRKQLVAGALTLLPPLVIALALWTAGSAFVGGFLAALFALAVLATIASRGLTSGAAVESQLILPELKREPLGPCPADPPTEQLLRHDEPVALSASFAPPESAVLIDEPIDEEDAERDPAIVQSITRRQESDGSEVVEGAVRMSFGPQDRSAVAHVAFIPPLSQRPRAECQVLVDFEGRVRIGLAQAYGLRIEARRPESCCDAMTIDVGFVATVSAVQSAAA